MFRSRFASREKILGSSLHLFMIALYPLGWVLITAIFGGRVMGMDTLALLAYSSGYLAAALVALHMCRKEYEKIRLFDPNSKVFNERFLLFSLRLEYNRSKRHSFPMALVIFSFNGMTSVSQRVGIDPEDLNSKLVNPVLQSIRTSDILSKLDNERYALLLSNSDIDGAQVVANRISAELNRELQKLRLGARVDPVYGICGLDCNGIKAPEDIMAGAVQAHLEASDSVRNKVGICGAHCN